MPIASCTKTTRECLALTLVFHANGDKPSDEMRREALTLKDDGVCRIGPPARAKTRGLPHSYLVSRHDLPRHDYCAHRYIQGVVNEVLRTAVAPVHPPRYAL